MYTVAETTKESTMSDVLLEDVLSYISYDPDTGEFTRLKNGKRADTHMTIGYKRVRVKIGDKKHEFLAHRLAWFIAEGKWPKGEIDHINGVRDDNRLINLRSVTRAENAKNLKRRSDNSSGFSGVIRHQTGWKVRISNKYIGYTGCLGKAIMMRKEVERDMNYHKNHGRCS